MLVRDIVALVELGVVGWWDRWIAFEKDIFEIDKAVAQIRIEANLSTVQSYDRTLASLCR